MVSCRTSVPKLPSETMNGATMQTLESQHDFKHYDRPETVQRYRRRTAGAGINFLLPNVYGPLFLDELHAALADTGAERLRILEFGCGAGMALHYLTEELGKQGIDVELAVGADFVPAMVGAAQQDLDEFGTSWAKERVRYVVASNEELEAGVAEGLGTTVDALAGTFHLAIGVNTFRYAIRHGNSEAVVGNLGRLLAPGAHIVVVDMNDRFPYGMRPTRREPGEQGLPIHFGRAWLPTLEGYAEPFASDGFDVLRQERFCWIPHSSTGLRFWLARAGGPVLDKLVPDHAMRSLVVARKR